MRNNIRNKEVKEEETILIKKYLTFELDESYALDMSTIVEILEYKPVTPVPETPPYIAGVINLRGTILPVINMRRRFLKEEKKDLLRKCIIVVDFQEMILGLIVDNVTDLIDLRSDQITLPPQVGDKYSHNFIKEIGILENDVTMIIDSDKLVNLDELDFLEETVEE